MLAQNVGIGTTTPTATLDVNGTLRYTDGSQGVGKVLTSNSDGYAKWTALPASSPSQSNVAGFGTWGECDNPGLDNYQPLLGKKAGDFFGTVVEMNDQFAFISAPSFDTLGFTDCGAVFVYKLSGDKWQLTQTLLDPDGASSDNFGVMMDVDSNKLIIASPFDDFGTYTNAGSFCYFEFDGNVWQYVEKVTESAPASSRVFGLSLAIQGDYLVVGAPNFETVGRAYIYQFYLGSFQLIQTISNSTGNADDQFGRTVAIGGDFVVVSAPFATRDSTNQGFAKVYRKVGTYYYEIQYLTVEFNRFKRFANFGLSIGISNEHLILSSMNEGFNLYQFDGTLFSNRNLIPELPSISSADFIQLSSDKLLMLARRTIENNQNKVVPIVFKKLDFSYEKLLDINAISKANTAPFNCKVNNLGYFVLGYPFEYSYKGKVIFGKIKY